VEVGVVRLGWKSGGDGGGFTRYCVLHEGRSGWYSRWGCCSCSCCCCYHLSYRSVVRQLDGVSDKCEFIVLFVMFVSAYLDGVDLGCSCRVIDTGNACL
jgi:hypothetical protein